MSSALSVKDPTVIEAAFCRTAGLSNLQKHFKPEVLEAADKLYGFGLQELLLGAAKRGGYDGRDKITGANVSEVLRAAFSTHSVTTALTSAGNKILLEGFNAVPQPWREIAAVRPVSDFKATTLFRLTADLEYEELPPSGEIKHGTLGQDAYAIQAKTYAKMFSLSRTDILNDDLGMFNDLRNRLGLGAAIKMNKVVWTLWLAASDAGAFWSEERGNLVTGAGLTEAGLGKAVKAFEEATGTDGNFLGLSPDRIVVPSALEATARVVYMSMERRETTADTRYETANVYFNRFRPVVVPELGSANYAGSSDSTYWIATNPAVLASLAVCFLNGNESPIIESSDADFGTLGVQFRGYHDFGVCMSEYRASVKATAA